MNQEIKKTEKKFSQNFKWNLTGSTFYEVLRITHQVFLLKVLESSDYGLYGSIFSIIYFTIYFSDLGLSNTLTPFLHIFTKNKISFKRIFLKMYIAPQIPMLAIATTMLAVFYGFSPFKSASSPFTAVIILITISESSRIFCRRFLHTVFKSKKTVISEMFLMPLYLSLVWIPYIVFNVRMTLNLIFIPYLFDSLLGNSFFFHQIWQYYKELPQSKAEAVPKNLGLKIIKLRILNHSTNISKEFFKGNFLTPFFAMQFGLKDAGIFNLINHIAESVKAIIKATIVFSGNPLLAKFKLASIQIKQKTFQAIFHKMNLIIYPLIIFTVINFKLIDRIQETTTSSPTALIMAALFLAIALMEYFFTAYNQFYILEEESGRLFIFKALELVLYYVFIISPNFSSPVTTLVGIVLLRILSLFIIAGNAYFKWKIKPSFYISYKPILVSILVSTIIYFLLR